jgi:acid phosphatase type 7
MIFLPPTKWRFEKDHKSAHLSVFHEASFGHGRLKIINGSSAHWSWHRNDDSVSTVRDELWLESLSYSNACQVGSHFVASAADYE